MTILREFQFKIASYRLRGVLYMLIKTLAFFNTTRKVIAGIRSSKNQIG